MFADAPYLVNHAEISLVARVDGGGATRAHGYVSCDGGCEWTLIAAVADQPIRFVAPADGCYDFFVVAENDGGASSPPPVAGDAPHLSLIVDTTPPTFQVHAMRTIPHAPGVVEIHATLVDEHLGATPLRVFYRAADADPWRDGGLAELRTSGFAWTAPASLDRCDVCVVATDLAGNRAVDELCGVRLRASDSLSVAARTNDAELSTPARAGVVGAGELVADVNAPLVLPPPVTSAPTLEQAEVDRLRRAAAEFIARGQLDLGAARLNELLAGAPQDADARLDRARLLLRLANPDGAEADAAAVLRTQPRHAAALDLLSEALVTRRAFGDAADRLEELAQIAPSADRWLRLGDVQFKLGRRDAARLAWGNARDAAGDDAAIRERLRRRLAQIAP